MKFVIIMACHNRKELSVLAVRMAQHAADAAGIDVFFTVFDDGSSDGTADALAGLNSSTIRLLHGDGSAFWASSMARAEADVLKRVVARDETFLVWLNDDVELDNDAFVRLREELTNNRDAVVVGAMRDPHSGATTYSGMRRSGIHPLRFTTVEPGRSAQSIDTFNGNLVAIPLGVAEQLGGIDGGFSHALADIDYGLRCSRLGIPVVLAPGSLGTCSRNAVPRRGRTLDDWKAFTGPKGGGNYASLKRVLRKGNPMTWRAFIAISYALWWVRRGQHHIRQTGERG